MQARGGEWWLRTEALNADFHCRAFHFPLPVILSSDPCMNFSLRLLFFQAFLQCHLFGDAFSDHIKKYLLLFKMSVLFCYTCYLASLNVY